MYIFSSLLGVEKNNDVACNVVLRKSNNWDTPADVLRCEHRLQLLCKYERTKRKYNKHDDNFWASTKRNICKRKKLESVSNRKEAVQVSPASTPKSSRCKEKTKKTKSGRKTKVNQLLALCP